MECGIVGLPQSGKSTLFSLLTGVEYDITTLREPRRGIAKLPDKRLDALAAVFNPKKITLATVEYVDVPGVVLKEGQRETYPPAYLAALRGVSMLALTVRAFNAPEVPHPSGSIDPVRDLTGAALEFIINDLVTVEKRLEKVSRMHDAESKKEAELLERCRVALNNEQALRELEFNPDEDKRLRSFAFLSLKPLLVVVNLGEDNASEADSVIDQLKSKVNFQSRVGWVALAAGIESEIAKLEPDDRDVFMAELGFNLPALDRMIGATFDLLGMVTFLTAGEKEVRGWPIPAGSNSITAAAAIHNDIARGFIRAEVSRWDDMVAAKGSEAKLREEGKLRLEGRDYIVKDGDVFHVRFNV